jgi:hypothetical protein
MKMNQNTHEIGFIHKHNQNLKTKEIYSVYIHQTSPAGHGYFAGKNIERERKGRRKWV